MLIINQTLQTRDTTGCIFSKSLIDIYAGEAEMCEEFVCSQAVTYECVKEAVAEARREEGEDVTNIENMMTLNSHMDPHTLEHISGWLSKKVGYFQTQNENVIISSMLLDRM